MCVLSSSLLQQQVDKTLVDILFYGWSQLLYKKENKGPGLIITYVKTLQTYSIIQDSHGIVLERHISMTDLV